ncbi:MAG: tRNA pseudouridine(38-40) synthase TruA [Candidatus Margulisiibacteriota bacterium]
MSNIRLVLMYDGAGYFGFAEQKEVPTVSGELKRSLKKLLGEEIPIIGASRTDRGVHALGQVVSFKSGSRLSANDYKGALNFLLPSDIRVLKAEEVGEEFHARFSARGKEYCYSIFEGRDLPFNLRNFSLHVRGGLDAAAMRKAADYLLGEHDFTSFAQEIIGSPIRRIDAIDIVEKNDPMGRVLEFRFRGNSFLYKMIRAIMGTLIEAGRGKKGPDEINEILKARDRKRAGATASPHGLCLIRVIY